MRDALEPLIFALGLEVVERAGGLALIRHDRPATPVSDGSLAVVEDRAPVRRERTLEPGPDLARVRFIDEAKDYQTGAVVVRPDAAEGGGMETGGGALDFDLPAVCGAGLAEATARRLLDRTRADRLTITVGPLEALRLEPGDRVRMDDASEWIVERATTGEDASGTPTLELIAPMETSWAAGTGLFDAQADGWRATWNAAAEPFLRILDLPPLLDAPEDHRPLAVVAGDPWRSCRVWAGPDETALTSRAEARRSATVGVLTQALGGGPVGRWDRGGTLTVRLEGEAPQSRSESAVLGGANAVAVETAGGWELLQFRGAELVGPDLWRLSGLLRGQQGTEAAMEAGAPVGALAVMLDEAVVRADLRPEAFGATMIWRAGPIDGPAGGPGVAERRVALDGRWARPWRPAGLSARRGVGGTALRWFGRDRLGDDWDAQRPTTGRWRIRILTDEGEVRRFEVDGDEAVYPDDWRAVDFPGGVATGARAAVAEAGGPGGWGDEATTPLAA